MLFIGIIAALAAVIIETSVFMVFVPLENSINFYLPLNLMIGFVLIEETVKLAVVFKMFFRLRIKSGIFSNSLFLGLGFSFIEIIFYSFKYSGELKSLTFPFFELIIVHLATLAVWGYYFSTRQKPTIKGILTAFLATTILHFLFNFSLIYNINQLIMAGLYLILIIFLFLKVFYASKPGFLPSGKI